MPRITIDYHWNHYPLYFNRRRDTIHIIVKRWPTLTSALSVRHLNYVCPNNASTWATDDPVFSVLASSGRVRNTPTISTSHGAPLSFLFCRMKQHWLSWHVKMSCVIPQDEYQDETKYYHAHPDKLPLGH